MRSRQFGTQNKSKQQIALNKTVYTMQRPNMSFTATNGTDVEREPLGGVSVNSGKRKQEQNSMMMLSKPFVFTIGCALLLIFILFHGSSSGVSTSFSKDIVYDRSDVGEYTLDKVKPYRFALVADLDRMSKADQGSKPRWRSVLRFATVTFDKTYDRWKVIFDAEHELFSYLGEAGRGMELSELLFYNEKLLAFDDRSGIVFEIVAERGYASFIAEQTTDKFSCVARHILTEGNGAISPKGQKTEWATEKDGELYVGSFGKEFTGPDGSILHKKNLWISVISSTGAIRHENWNSKYEMMRAATGTSSPGYMIHEAIMFNQYRREWVVLPRRVSREQYDEKADESMGSNIMLVINENFDRVERIVTVGQIVPERGFSSFKFVPGTHGKVILALKTVEKEDKVTGESEQTSFVSMFDLTGTVLLPETEVPGGYKFEGLEFI